MKKLTALLLLAKLPLILLTSQTVYVENGEEEYQDMLTPEYYLSTSDSPFLSEIHTFLHYSRLVPFQLPFIDSNGHTPEYTTGREFGAGIGPGGTGSHHPAIDYYIESDDNKVNLYAPCDGYVEIDSSVSRYRHFVSVSQEIRDSSNQYLGLMKVILAHTDLDLDAEDNINPHGTYVKKGELISSNLYSGTMGGPHLHLEIRYYRPTDSGYEDFYGGPVGNKTAPSAGPWSYGYWNPNSGYGFAHPLNHINQVNLNALIHSSTGEVLIYPNPFKNYLTLEVQNPKHHSILTILDVFGRKHLHQENILNNKTIIDLSELDTGAYFVKIENDRFSTILRAIKN